MLVSVAFDDKALETLRRRSEARARAPSRVELNRESTIQTVDTVTDSRRKLVRQLQGACSGELAAGFAYPGHARSLPAGADRDRILEIEAEEWHHRELVLELLGKLGARPRRVRELVFWVIGKAIGLSCHFGGWFFPMYGAGLLERSNIAEYEHAATYAAHCGREDMIDCIFSMAEGEWEHGRFFRERIAGHPFLALVPLWKAPPPKHAIRSRDSVGEPEPRVAEWGPMSRNRRAGK